MEDKTIVCEQCGQEFVFTAGEQEFYTEKGFHEPKKCKACRDAFKAKKAQEREDRYKNNNNYSSNN